VSVHPGRLRVPYDRSPVIIYVYLGAAGSLFICPCPVRLLVLFADKRKRTIVKNVRATTALRHGRRGQINRSARTGKNVPTFDTAAGRAVSFDITVPVRRRSVDGRSYQTLTRHGTSAPKIHRRAYFRVISVIWNRRVCCRTGEYNTHTRFVPSRERRPPIWLGREKKFYARITDTLRVRNVRRPRTRLYVETNNRFHTTNNKRRQRTQPSGKWTKIPVAYLKIVFTAQTFICPAFC